MITSPQNPRVQAARKLRRRAHRDRQGAFLVEGPMPITEALDAGADIVEIFTQTPDHDIIARARQQSVTVVEATAPVLAALSDTVTPQEIVAVVRTPELDLAAAVVDADLIVVLAGVRDPGNAGTIMRSAVAAGASAVVVPAGGVDPFHPKTVRASAGTLFRLPVVRGVGIHSVVEALRARRIMVCGADARAGRSMYEVDLTQPVAFVLGNEAWGLPDELRSLSDQLIGIPMPGPAESLNVGIAGSILLFEVARQRRLSSANP